MRLIVDEKEPTKTGINVKSKETTMPELEDALSCNVCDFDTETQSELDYHSKRLHVSLLAPTKTPVENNSKSVDKGEQTKTHDVEKSKPKNSMVNEGETLLNESVVICEPPCAKEFDNESKHIEHM